MVESIICIAFIVFVLARVLLGKEDGNDKHKKYPPSYY